MNRQNIFKSGILDHFKLQLSTKETSITVIKGICIVLRSLVLDDDIRHEYGKASERATIIARQTLCTLTKLLSSTINFKISISNTLNYKYLFLL
jgi:hypothetical protein